MATTHAWTIRNSSFCGNRSNNQGGAIYLSSAINNRIENTAFSNNITVAHGGALFVNVATLSLNNVFFVGNQAGVAYTGARSLATRRPLRSKIVISTTIP
jgi:predicted outer membrane repeat protein